MPGSLARRRRGCLPSPTSRLGLLRPRSTSRARWAIAACALVALTGCLSQSYEVSRDELLRVSQLPPSDRGGGVRVSQQAQWNGDVSPGDEDRPSPRAGGGIALWGVGHHHYGHHHGPRRGRIRASRGFERRKPASTSTTELTAAVAVAAVTAATFAVTLGATEGARFDGWLRVPDDQQVLLVREGGERSWVSLDSLDETDLRGVSHGAIAGFDEGVRRGRRFALDRTGWAYQAELGVATLRSTSGHFSAVTGRAALGYMPLHRLGLLVGGEFSAGQSPFEAEGAARFTSEADQVESRAFTQLEWWPLSLSRLHLGPYIAGGYAWASQDTPRSSTVVAGPYASVGAAFQLDWTTRLALTLRLGASMLPSLEPEHDAALGWSGYRIAAAASLGLAIY